MPTRLCWKRPPGVTRDGAPTPPTSPSAAPTNRPSASLPPWSARSARPSPTRARESATRASSSAARPARRSARSDHRSRPHRAKDRTREYRKPTTSSCRPAGCGASGGSATGCSAPRTAPAGGLPQLEAHLRADDQRPDGNDPGLGQHRSIPRSRPSSSTAATRPPRQSSAAWSPSVPRRPVLTRFASTAEATSIMAAWRPWPRPPARRG